MLISLHMPKVAGNSFLHTLERHFGAGLAKDYVDMSRIQDYLAGKVHPTQLCDAGYSESECARLQCIHGHFLPAKYLKIRANCKSAKFVTWLRNPVERLVSHYNFFMRSYDPLTAGPLFKRIVEESWSLEKFCFSSEYKNFYKKYLWGFPVGYFDFIGIVERYDEDLQRFGKRYFGIEAYSCRVNCAIDGSVSNYNVDPVFRREVESYHSEDMELYKQILESSSDI